MSQPRSRNVALAGILFAASLASAQSGTLSLDPGTSSQQFASDQLNVINPPQPYMDFVGGTANAGVNNTHIVLIREGGTIVEYGRDPYNPGGFEGAPAGLTGVASVATSYFADGTVNYNGSIMTTWAVKTDGSVLNWGSPGRPAVPPNLPPIKKIVASGPYALAISTTGYLYNIGWEAAPLPANLRVRDICIDAINYVGSPYHTYNVQLSAVKLDGTAGFISIYNGKFTPYSLNGAPIGNVIEMQGEGNSHILRMVDSTVTSVRTDIYGVATDFTPAGIDNVVSIAKVSWSGYAAVESNGDVVRWGDNGVPSTIHVPGVFKAIAARDLLLLLVDTPSRPYLEAPYFTGYSTTSNALSVVVKEAAAVDRTVHLSTTAPDYLPVPAEVTVPAGQTRVDVPFLHPLYAGPYGLNSITSELENQPFEMTVRDVAFILESTPQLTVHGGTKFQIDISQSRYSPGTPRAPAPIQFVTTSGISQIAPFYFTGGTGTVEMVATDHSKIVREKFSSPAGIPPVGTTVKVLPNDSISLTVSATNPMFANQRGEGTVTLAAPAPDGGVLVNLVGDNPNLTLTDEPIKILKGQTTRTFLIKSESVGETIKGKITVYTDSGAASTIVTIKPMKILNFTLDPSTVSGGQTVMATIKLAGPVRLDQAVKLSVSDPSVVSVPTTVTVLALSDTVTFPISTSVVTSLHTVTINATVNGVAKSVKLIVKR